jgi:hypothetical protein
MLLVLKADLTNSAESAEAAMRSQKNESGVLCIDYPPTNSIDINIKPACQYSLIISSKHPIISNSKPSRS